MQEGDNFTMPPPMQSMKAVGAWVGELPHNPAHSLIYTHSTSIAIYIPNVLIRWDFKLYSMLYLVYLCAMYTNYNYKRELYLIH